MGIHLHYTPKSQAGWDSFSRKVRPYSPSNFSRFRNRDQPAGCEGNKGRYAQGKNNQLRSLSARAPPCAGYFHLLSHLCSSSSACEDRYHCDPQLEVRKPASEGVTQRVTSLAVAESGLGSRLSDFIV